MNTIAQRAIHHGRDYATSEDVQELIDEGADLTQLRLDAVEILRNGAGMGCEDRNLFAFVAWSGEKTGEEVLADSHGGYLIAYYSDAAWWEACQLNRPNVKPKRWTELPAINLEDVT